MKAIALISGGLDSILAARLIQDLGIEIIPLYFQTPFCTRPKNNFTSSQKAAQLVKEGLNTDLKIIDVGRDFLKILENPRYGFGSNMNPCIDCKILMFNKARELLEEWKASFVISGEVLGQRPMSQHRKALELIEKRSGLSGLLLRPLSAKVLEDTLPEKNNWIARERLLNFSGRGRRPQMNLAAQFKIENYPNAAGGCLLTDPKFSSRLKELIEHKELCVSNIELLKVGRHFRLDPKTKLVVGRDEKENEQLEKLAVDNDYLFYPPEAAGPTSLGRGVFSEGQIELAARITAYYCDLQKQDRVNIMYKKLPQEVKVVKVLAAGEEEIQSFKI